MRRFVELTAVYRVMKSEKLLVNRCLLFTSITGCVPYLRSSSFPSRLMQKKPPSTCPTKYSTSRYVSMSFSG